MGDPLGENFAVVAKDTLYRCLDKLLAHKADLFNFLQQRWKTLSLAPGLTPRSLLDKMAALQMVDVHLPTTDGQTIILSRYTEPEADQAILLQPLKPRLAGAAAAGIAAAKLPAPK
ncbi:MAG: hypothetical protein JOY71_18475 [Acetobacteraceae bacterium]|nr:hypothetical protein [Acetobacteraceae bacterium]